MLVTIRTEAEGRSTVIGFGMLVVEQNLLQCVAKADSVLNEGGKGGGGTVDVTAGG